jgi:putative solute:sodium symporter small subunit
MRENRGATHPMTDAPDTDTDRYRRYWRRNLRTTAGLLAIWFIVTFVAAFFARELSFQFFGWPFSFWLAAQGSLVVYLALVCYYAWAVDKLDREHDMAED